MLDPWLFLVGALASFRLVRFFIFDSLIGFNLESRSSFSKVLDRWAYDSDGRNRGFVRGKIGDLLTCPYCLGFWISVGVWAALVWGPTWALYVVVVFALAGVQSLLSIIERRLSHG